ncbi:MAG: Ig-like domain-containing protein, partial [Gemmatimonadetes bacterium]|nr:Ig-like domain-containing protein [Gemmatimonadota bacterium]
MRKLLLVLGLAGVAAPASAQIDTTALSPAQKAAMRVASLQAPAAPLSVQLGDTVDLKVTALDAQGQVVEGARVLFSAPGNVGTLIGGTRFAATKVGSGSIAAFVLKPPTPGQRPSRVTGTLPVVVHDLPVDKVEIVPLAGRLYVGTTLEAKGRALVAGGRQSVDAAVSWSIAPARVATVDRLGNVTANLPGSATLTARSGGKSASLALTVSANPVTQVRITGGADSAKTGDVLRFTVAALSGAGRPVPGVVPLWSVYAEQTG